MKKTKSQRSRRVRRGKTPRSSLAVSPLIELKSADRMPVTSTWTYGIISTNTSGTISHGDISPSFQNSTQYAYLQHLWGEVRLLKAEFIFTIVQPFNSTQINGSVAIGTNMIANGTTYVAPTTRGAVLSCSKPGFLPTTFSSGPLIYKMPVPRDLAFSAIYDDAPSVATPYAGSPGCVYLYATGLTASVDYFRLDVVATHEVRGRQLA